MLFVLIQSGANKGKFHSPSGKVLTEAQVKAHYAEQERKAKQDSKSNGHS